MADGVRERIRTAGVYKVHARGCGGGRCHWRVGYQATVYSPRDGKLFRKHFETLREAERWRGGVDRGEARAQTRKTVDQARPGSVPHRD